MRYVPDPAGCWSPASAGLQAPHTSPFACPGTIAIRARLRHAEHGEIRRLIAQANAQATKLIEEARAAAARVQEEETKKAIASAEKVISKAHEAAEQDHARMLTNLKREVGRLVIQTTANVTEKILTPEDHRRLDEETAKVVTE